MYVTIIIIVSLFILAWIYAEVTEMRSRRSAFESVSLYLKEQVEYLVQCNGKKSHVREEVLLRDRVEVITSYHPEWIDRLLYTKRDCRNLELIINQLKDLSSIVDRQRSSYMLRASSKLKTHLEKYGDTYAK